MKSIIHKALKKRGKQIIEYPSDELRRRRLIMDSHHINNVLDIGANIGQYGLLMRELGYSKKLISFEPMSQEFKELEKNASSDNNWFTKNYALGDADGKSIINISGNSYSSSILEMLPAHVNSAPSSNYVAQEEIEIKTLDGIYDSLCSQNDNVMLKVDTQGFEKNVLDGAVKSLDKISIIELEMSLVPLYQSDTLYLEMIKFMDEKGFDLYFLEHVFSNPTTGQLLQVDGMFVRRNQ